MTWGPEKERKIANGIGYIHKFKHLYLFTFFSFLVWMSSVIWTWLQQWTPSNCARQVFTALLLTAGWLSALFTARNDSKTDAPWYDSAQNEKKKRRYIYTSVSTCAWQRNGPVILISLREAHLGCARRSPQNEKSIHWIKVMQNGWLAKMAAGFIFSAP